jgi:hypothetical protein
MFDTDLAELYEVETKALNQAVKRNIERFPEDFAFQPNSSELYVLRSQIVTLKSINTWNHMKRHPPFVFTENGIAMLSSVLNSPRAIQINISIMRIFTKLRSFLMLEKNLSERVDKLESGTNKVFKVVFERLDSIEDVVRPKLSPNRKKIGL